MPGPTRCGAPAGRSPTSRRRASTSARCWRSTRTSRRGADPVARAIGPEDEVEGLDEEFLYHLSRGSDLLAKGEAEAAKASLERAAQLRPRDSKVLGLLGQAAYR